LISLLSSNKLPQRVEPAFADIERESMDVFMI